MGRKPEQLKINRQEFNYALKRLGLTQEELGKKIGYSREAISAAVNQRRGVSAEFIDLICRELDAHPDYLTGDEQYFVMASLLGEKFVEQHKDDPNFEELKKKKIDPLGRFILGYQTHKNEQLFFDKENTIRYLIFIHLEGYSFFNDLSDTEKTACMNAIYGDIRSALDWMISHAIQPYEYDPDEDLPKGSWIYNYRKGREEK